MTLSHVSLLLCLSSGMILGCSGLIDAGSASAGDSDGGTDIFPWPDGGADGVSALCVVNTDGQILNLRESPSTDAAVLATMPAGSELQSTGRRGGDGDAWLELEFREHTGWAHGDFIGECPEPVEGMGEGFEFLLPWEAGNSHTVTQGHNNGAISHTGMQAWAWDFGMPVGTPLYATHDGTVRLAKFSSTSYGCSPTYADLANYVVIQRSDGIEALYLHLKDIPAGQEPVVAGQQIKRGDFIGYSGQSGWTCGPHLHLQFQKAPGNGGGPTYWNQSVQADFWDTGAAYDPPQGSNPVSANGPQDES